MASENVKFRLAVESDVPLLEYWDELPHVIESGFDDDEWDWKTEIAREDESWRWMFIAELAGKPIGCVLIIDPKKEITHYWSDCAENLRALDIWIGDEKALGKGYGTQMMRIAIDFCFEDELVTAILIDPLSRNLDAIRFYERLGFEFVERRKFDEDDCRVYQLKREKWHA